MQKHEKCNKKILMLHWLTVLCLCTALLGEVESRQYNTRLCPIKYNNGFLQPHRLYPGAIINFGNPIGYLRRVKTREGLYSILDNVPVYIVTDGSGTPVESHYPIDGQEKTTKYCQNESDTHCYRNKLPEAEQIVKEFIQMFNLGPVDASSSTSVHNIDDMKHTMPRIVLYFMDPNACAAQIKELRRQNLNVRAKVVTLGDYVKHWHDSNRQNDPVLLPCAEALTSATQQGKYTFKGTPVFITDPAIALTTSEDINQQYNPATDKLVVFTCPKQAEMIYNSARKNAASTVVGGNKMKYKVISQKRPWTPKILTSSVENLCQRIDQEPYWTAVIHIESPSPKLDRDAEEMLQNSIEDKPSLWNSIHRLVAIFM
ncbi:dihydrodipicolinate reductase, putative [Babesia ovis]|uniref:Dihydrodipicolinate reductase, putative n=1 Tax=Babesia ovis TaxID=5869 RepID=A0A9W5TCN6_BABOV|nr:dihydrodipicolinate reductase, putative [Babesia ovis]